MHHLNGYELVDEWARAQIAKILFKPITIATFTLSTTQAAMGARVPLTASWKLSKEASSLKIGSTDIPPSIEGSISLGEVASSTNYTLTAIDAEDGAYSATKTASISFLNYIYYGTSVGASFGAIVQDKLTKKLASNRKQTGLSITANTNEYVYYCVPIRLGECSFKVGGFAGGFEDPVEVTVANENGFTEQYYVYRSTYPSLGTITIEVL